MSRPRSRQALGEATHGRLQRPARDPRRPRRRLGALLFLLLAAQLHSGLGCVQALAPTARQPATRSAAPAPLLNVRESRGRDLLAWPLTGALPLPPGKLVDASKARFLLDGKPVASQARVTSRWKDGSARWLLVDWQADLKANQIRQLSLGDAAATAAVPPQTNLRLREDGDGIDVDTGALRFRVPKRRAALLERIQLPGGTASDVPLTCFLVLDGARQDCLAPTSVTVLEAGPLRARLEVRGRYARGFVYVVRLDVYAGKPFVRFLHSFEQHSPEPILEVSRIAVEVPLPTGTATQFRIGIENKPDVSGALPESGIALRQLDNLRYTLADEARDGHAAGWAAIQGSGSGLALAARWLWQEYPKGIQLEPKRLVYDLWPAQAPAARLGSGVAKTHEWAVWFGPERVDPGILAALGGGVPLAYADPGWTASTGALRNALRPDDDSRNLLERLRHGYRRQAAFRDSERWDDCGSPTCKDRPERPRQGFYGMLHWGDWNFPGYRDDVKGRDAWGNLEYDTTQVFALAFAATGESRFAEDMTAAARHFLDVDTIHYSASHPTWVGMNHPKNPTHFTFDLGGTDLGHTWTEGLLTYYLLSGDERALAAARGIGDHLARRIRTGRVKGNPRQWGWPQIALVALYEATGDHAYRSAAIDYARGGMQAHPPDTIRDWKLGILAEALAYTDSMQADPEIRAWLTRYAAAVVAYSQAADPRFMPALAYTGVVTHQPELQRIAAAAVRRLGFGSWPKPFTIAGRIGFSTLATLQSAAHPGEGAPTSDP